MTSWIIKNECVHQTGILIGAEYVCIWHTFLGAVSAWAPVAVFFRVNKFMMARWENLQVKVIHSGERRKNENEIRKLQSLMNNHKKIICSTLTDRYGYPVTKNKNE